MCDCTASFDFLKACFLWGDRLMLIFYKEITNSQHLTINVLKIFNLTISAPKIRLFTLDKQDLRC